MRDGEIQAEFCYEQGKLLKAKRESKKLSQSDLGLMVGVHRNTILRWETGDAEVGTWMLLRLADSLGCTHLSLMPPREFTWGRGVRDALRESDTLKREIKREWIGNENMR